MLLLSIGDFVSEVFLGIIMTLDVIIYGLVNSAYKIFMAIASARLLSSDVYYEIANRIYIIIGVLMLFVLSYAVLKAIVDPDNAIKGAGGSGIVKRVIIAVIGLAITPVLFNVLYQAQGLFLENDVLGKVFFRIQNTENIEVNGVSGNPDEQIKNIGGAVAATSIWQAFFHPMEGYDASNITSSSTEYTVSAIVTGLACAAGIAASIIAGIASGGAGFFLIGGAAVYLCAQSINGDIEQAGQIEDLGGDITLEQAYASAAGTGNFHVFLIFIDNVIEDGEIEYMWGVSTLCGAFALYAFGSFSIDMGIRAAKLAYYQIIAPIPLIMQVLPKYKDNFSKYMKNVVSTFLEVFIRISVVYIVVFVICHLQDLFSSVGSLWGNASLSGAEKFFALALLILGLLIFAKSAPDIICQSLNIEKGSMKLGIGKKLAEGGAFAAGGIGYAGVTSAVRNWKDPSNKDKGVLAKARSAVAGFGSGTARAAFNQFGPGPNRKPAMTLHDMLNVGERSAQGATDKRDSRDKRQAELAAARKDYENASDEFNDALAKGNIQAQKEAQAKMKDAKRRINESTAMGALETKIYNKLDSWSAGSVSTAEEEAKIKFMGGLDGLKDKLRDKTAKKSYVQAAMDYEKELNARQVEQFDQSSYQAAFSQYLATHQAATDAEKTAEAARLRSMYTLSDDEYRQRVNELSNMRTAAKKAREAAQDRAIVELAAEKDAGVLGILTPFFQENADFISRYKSDRFKIDKNGTEMTLADIITQNFGDEALSGGFNPEAAFTKKTGFKLKDLSIKGADGNPLSITYQVDTVSGSATAGEYVMVNKDGQKVNLVTRLDSSGNTYYETEVMTDQAAAPREHYKNNEFFLTKVFETIAAGGSADSETSTSVAGDAGKWSKSNIVNSKEYQSKVVRKRQMEDAKSGRK